MYEYVMEERTVKALALLGVLAMVGMAVTPLVVGDAWGIGSYYLTKNGMNAEAGLGWTACGIMVNAMYAGAIGTAFGGPAGLAAGMAIGA